ncbi:DUF6801 domain-containing protein [Amycolatopsis sp. NPDC059021]|uniref:DUF6801 domain-containing protein n=1 Tax=Amycolatopsis sp. NPDC059021 TaxID=3346704 RepID=UPI0036715510
MTDVKFSPKSKRPFHATVAGAAAVIAATLGIAGADPGHAASLTLKCTCPFPLIGEQTLVVKIGTGLPGDAVAGKTAGPITFEVGVAVPADSAAGLALGGATTIEPCPGVLASGAGNLLEANQA